MSQSRLLWPEPQEVLRLLILHDRFLGDHRRLLLHPVLHLIDNDRHNNHDPFDDHLPELAHPHHHQPVGEKTDDKRTNQRTQDGSPAAMFMRSVTMSAPPSSPA